MNQYLSDYLQYHEPFGINKTYLTWSAISLASACMGRRVWLPRGDIGKTFSNLYVFIIGTAGIGKSEAIRTVSRFVGEIDTTAKMHQTIHPLYTAPNKVNETSLLMRLCRIYKEYGDSDMYMLMSEAGVSFEENGAKGIIGDLLDYFDCPSKFDKETRTFSQEQAYNVCINILAATTPSFLREFMPNEKQAQGFTARCIMVYEPQENHTRIRSPRKHEFDPAMQHRIFKVLERLRDKNSPMQGEMEETQAAFAFYDQISEWYYEKKNQFPEESLLGDYFARKNLMVKKVGMVLACAAGRMTVEIDDYKLAEQLLTQLEPNMTKIFKPKDLTASDDSVNLVKYSLFPKGTVFSSADLIKHLAEAGTANVNNLVQFQFVLTCLQNQGIIRAIDQDRFEVL